VSTPADPYPLSGPTGTAVDEAGDVYVADTLNFRVEKFDSVGNFVLMFGKEVDKTTKGDVCTAESGDTCQAGVQGVNGAGEFSDPTYVAVDDSADPSKGDVYVGDVTTNTVYKFSAGGEFLATVEAVAGTLAGIAVDGEGNLWVYHEGVMSEYTAEGTPVQAWASGFGISQAFSGLALDTAKNLFVQRGFPVIEEFSETGSDLGEAVENNAQQTGYAFNRATSDLYVNTGTAIERVDIGASSCVPAVHRCPASDNFGIGHITSGVGVAVNEVKNVVYTADDTSSAVLRFVSTLEATTEQAEAIGTTTATLVGTVNPKGTLVEHCEIEYGTTLGYGDVALCGEVVGEGTEPVQVHGAATGLPGGTTIHFRIVAKNAHGTVRGDDHTFETLPVAALKDLTTENLTGASVDLIGVIDPRGLATAFHFEIDGRALPEGHLAAGTSDVHVSQHVEALAPNTAYHWRLVATDEDGVVESPDQTFVYEEGMGERLPDGRAYEMVTPPNKNGALIGDVEIGFGTNISENGERLSADAIQPFGTAESGIGARGGEEGDPFLFQRSPSGWFTTPLAPAATRFEVNSAWNVDPNTGDALFSIPSPPGGQDDFYVREADGEFVDIGPSSPPEDGPKGSDPWAANGLSGTADFSHMLFVLSSNRFSFDGTTGGESLYEYIGRNSQPLLVGVTGGAGSHDLISKCATHRGGGGTFVSSFYNSISEDGSVVFFTAAGPCESGTGANAARPVPANELYARINQDETVPISAKSSGDCTTAECQSAPTRAAEFEGASTDGKRVFFTSTEQLTNGASEDPSNLDSANNRTQGCRRATAENGCNLYEYDFSEPAEHRLIDVSAGDESGDGPRVRGVVAVSSDGSHVYFVSEGVLTPEVGAAGRKALNGQNNLYAYERDEAHPAGKLAFIAALPASDEEVMWSHGVGFDDVTPEGRFLVFASSGDLTPDESRTDESRQIFRYDAQNEELIRISTGQNGFDNNGNDGVGNARIVEPEWYDIGSGPVRGDPTMSHDGSYIFFQSPIALTPDALNDVQVTTEGDLAQNIYEYHEGHVYLISDGHDTTAGGEFKEGLESGRSSVRLIGADATGANVIFTTGDRLDASRDTDTGVDYYDARICTTLSRCVPSAAPAPQQCNEEASCHGLPSASPPVIIPATVGFSGSGNSTSVEVVKSAKKRPLTRAQKLMKALKKCRAKHSKGKRLACEREARRLYGKTSRAALGQKRRAH
jgi:hypothetical protein